MRRVPSLTTLLAAAALTQPLAAQASGPIDPERLSAIVRTLASDAYEGRAPGTAGEKKTVAYLVDRMKALGLEPAAPGGSFVQPVPMIRTRIGTGTMRAAVGVAAAMSLVQGEGIYVSTIRPVDRVAIADAPMVFVGYGVSAPERQWDDFKGVDLKGKVAVFLINDPDFSAEAGDPVAGRFGGRREAYYGRWTYK